MVDIAGGATSCLNFFDMPAPVWQGALQALGLLGAAYFAATAGRKLEHKHNAEKLSRGLNGLLQNYRRHALANMIEIARNIKLFLNEKPNNPGQYEINAADTTLSKPTKELIKKQFFETSDLTDKTKDRTGLLAADMVAQIEHLYLRIRNINIELESALARHETGQFSNEDATIIASSKFYIKIFDRNQLIADQCNSLIESLGLMKVKKDFSDDKLMLCLHENDSGKRIDSHRLRHMLVKSGYSDITVSNAFNEVEALISLKRDVDRYLLSKQMHSNA